ncbi:MAG: DUF1918 domain-containing protein [Pseudonocardiaceae bacterium]
MTAHIGEQIMIISQSLHQPVREGEIREIRDGPAGAVYLVRWSDTGHEDLLRSGPDVMIKRWPRRGSRAVAAGTVPWLSRLRHPLQWRHTQDQARRQQARDEYLAKRVEEIIDGLGLTHTEFSIGGGRIVYIPGVVSVTAGPPRGLNIRLLPGQSPKDFAAHASTIAYDLGVARVEVVPRGPSLIRLDLLPAAGAAVPLTDRELSRS